MSPFPRYHSKVLTTIMRQLNVWRDRSQTLFRRTKMIGRWTIEAALYPLYQWVQIRSGPQLGQSFRQKLGQTIRYGRAKLALLAENPEASTPIETVLSTIQMVSPTPINMDQRQKDSGFEENSSLSMRAVPQQSSFKWIRKGLAVIRKVSSVLQTRSLLLARGKSKTLGPQVGQVRVSHQIIVQAPSERCTIQGIASLLHNKALVLVTPDQDVLDILSPQQQIILRRKINWAVYRFGLRFRLQQAQNQLTSSLRWVARLQGTGSQRSPQLSGATDSDSKGMVERLKILPFLQQTQRRLGQFDLLKNLKPLRGFKRWIFQSIVGALAALPIVAIPAIAAETRPSPLPKAQEHIDTLWVDPNHLKTKRAWDELGGMTFQQTQGHTWLATAPSPRPKTSLPASVLTADTTLEIPIEAEFLGYDPHLLERILGWLDAFLVQLEAAIAFIWNSTGLFVIIVLTTVQKIRQMIFG